MPYRKGIGAVSNQPSGWGAIQPFGIGAGIIWAPLLSAGWYTTVFDSSGSKQTITTNGAPSAGFIQTPAGKGRITHPSGGGNGATSYSTNAALISDGGDFSAFWYGYPQNLDGANSGIVNRGYNGNDSVRLYFTSATNFRFAWIDSSPAQFNLDVTIPSTALGISAGQEFAVCVTKIGAIRNVYIRAQDRSVVTGTQSTGTSTGRAGTFGWTLGTGTIQSHENHIAAYAWNRGLSSQEAFALLINPWLPYSQPRGRRIISQAQSTGIAFDAASNSGTQTAQSTYTFARPITGTGTFLGVDVSILSAGATVTSIIDNYDVAPVNLKFIGLQATVTSLGSVECWGLAGAVTGTKNVQVNLSGSITSAATAASYTGVHQTSPTEAFNSAQATNVGAADATVNITTIADNCWVHGAVVANDDAITANQTSRNNVSFAAVGSGANEDNNVAKTPAGSVTMSYTGVGALKTWAIGGYAIRPTAAASNEPVGAQYLNIGSGVSRFGATVG